MGCGDEECGNEEECGDKVECESEMADATLSAPISHSRLGLPRPSPLSLRPSTASTTSINLDQAPFVFQSRTPSSSTRLSLPPYRPPSTLPSVYKSIRPSIFIFVLILIRISVSTPISPPSPPFPIHVHVHIHIYICLPTPPH